MSTGRVAVVGAFRPRQSRRRNRARAGDGVVAFIDDDAKPGLIAGHPVDGRLLSEGLKVVSLVHPRATVSPSASLEPGSVVMAGAVINADARCARGVIVNSGAVIDHGCELGEFVHVSPNAALGGGVRVGARSHVGIQRSLMSDGRRNASSLVDREGVGTSALVLGCERSRLFETALPCPAALQPDGMGGAFPAGQATQASFRAGAFVGDSPSGLDGEFKKMAAKKRTGKDSEPPSATTEGGFTVLMEHMERQNRATIEAVQSLREHVTRRFEETEARAGLRFDSLEAAVRLNSTDIKELKVSVTELKVSVTELKADVTELKADVTELKADVKELKADVKELKVSLSALAARVDRIEELLAHKLAGPAPADLEARIRRIEERLGLIP